jgi:DNA polymerase III psi subunit
MDKDISFLKYLIDEEIYILNEVYQNETNDSESLKETESDQNQLYENNTLIFLEYPEKNALPESYQNFLSKILGSVDLDPGRVEMIYSEELNNITADDFKNCTVIAFLSEVPDNLSVLFDSDAYVIRSFQKNKSLLCDPLEAINTDTALKRKLWEQLKVLYDQSGI